MQLSEHLTLAEVTKSQTATRLGIDNDPDAHQLAALKAIAEHIFEPVRNHFGVPIGISSGLRSKALNKAIGGSSTFATLPRPSLGHRCRHLRRYYKRGNFPLHQKQP